MSITRAGTLRHHGWELIHYRISVPSSDEFRRLSDFFEKCADNFYSYLVSLTNEMIPTLKSLLKSGERSREIKRKLDIPLEAFLTWYVAARDGAHTLLICVLRFVFPSGREVIRKKPLLLKMPELSALKINKKRLKTIEITDQYMI